MANGSFWPGVPFLRLLFPVISGIYLGDRFPVAIKALSVILFLTGIVWIVSEIWRKKFLNLTLVARLTPCVFIFFFAAGLTWLADSRNNGGWFGHFYKEGDILKVRLSEDPVKRKLTLKSEADVQVICRSGTAIPVNGKIILYLPDSSSLFAGDILYISRSPDSIRHTNNPGEFNYARWLSRQNIFHSVFLSKEDFHLAGREQDVSRSLINSSRRFILRSIQKFIREGNGISGLAEALVIGYRGDLDKDLLQKYSSTGVVHIIAVSGLHLGLIYVALKWLLEFLFRRKQPGLRSVLIICFLWFFSILTGSTASVLRAALMFTLLIAGSTWFRQASVYNTLSASAVLLLLYDPYLLWDAGFQLSYCAVTGIVWLQPIIFRACFSASSIVRKVWEMTSITLAAQLMTLPLTLYYFNQFPILFLPANLVVVPLSTIALFSGIATIILSGWGTGARIMGYITGELINWMNLIVSWFDAVPYSMVHRIFLSEISVICLFALITGLALRFVYKWRFGSWLIYIPALIISLSVNLRKVEQGNQQKIIIYKTKGSNIAFVAGRSLYLLEGEQGNSAVKRSADWLGIRNIETKQTNQVKVGSKNVLVANDSIIRSGLPKAPISLLIIMGDAYPEKEFLERCKPEMVVADGSNRLWKIAKWKSFCDKLLLRFHSVPQEGAFILSL